MLTSSRNTLRRRVFMGKHLKGMLVSLISALSFFSLFLIPSAVNAHDNISVHPYIAKQAFFVLPYDTSHEIYQYLGMDYFDNSTGATACDRAKTGGLIAEGAKEEDDYDPLVKVCNEEYLYFGYLHHFYKYDTGKGLFGSEPSALDYAKVYFDRARQSYTDDDKGTAYWYLGRIAHLIADVSVPAHVLDDPHEPYACDKGLGQDSYEFFMSRNFSDYSAGSVSGFEQLPVIMSVDDIFTQLVSHTAAYPSDEVDGTDTSRDSWNNNSEMCDYFFWRDPFIADENLNVIGSDLMPQAIKYTAALYQLFWLRTHDQGDTTATASDISVGAAEYAEIYPAGDHDFFSFTVTDPGKYAIYTRGTTNTYGVLYNGSYEILTQDNDSGEPGNFRIEHNIITPGTYYVEVKGGAPGVIGNYELHIDNLPPNSPVVSGPTPTKDTTPTWTWTSGGGGSGTFRYKSDNADLTTGATITTATSFTPVTALAKGTHTLYVQEVAASGSWSASGSKAIVIDTTVPTLGIITPTPVTTEQGRGQTFTASYGDKDGYANLKYVELQVGTTANGSNAIWVRYTAATNKLNLFNNEAIALLAATCTPGNTGTISNSQGTLNCLKTTVESSGNDITVNWKITPKTAFAGATAKNLKMRATDKSGLTTGLIKKGSWTITSTASGPKAAIDHAPEGSKEP